MSRDDPPARAGAATPRSVPCPSCGKTCAFEPWNPWRPFCSERCRTADLGGWASESYRIPGKPGEDEPGDEKQDPDG